MIAPTTPPPPSGAIQAAIEQLKAPEPTLNSVLAKQQQELTLAIPNVCDSFRAGYELGLQTARLMMGKLMTVEKKPENEPLSQPLPDSSIKMIHNGLMIPNQRAVQRMAREIRKWRGEENPDAV